MDFPEGAKVLNVSIDLGVHGRDAAPQAAGRGVPARHRRTACCGWSALIWALRRISRDLADVFDFAKDYLGLLKAAVIASGLVPPGIEGSGQSLADLLARHGRPGLGPRTRQLGQRYSQRLAPGGLHQPAGVADRLSACGPPARPLRLTGQLQEHERRLVLARALLGEWLGGSRRRLAGFRRRLAGNQTDRRRALARAATRSSASAAAGSCPQHRILERHEVSPRPRRRLQDSLVLVHGGMAQNVGPDSGNGD